MMGIPKWGRCERCGRFRQRSWLRRDSQAIRRYSAWVCREDCTPDAPTEERAGCRCWITDPVAAHDRSTDSWRSCPVHGDAALTEGGATHGG